MRNLSHEYDQVSEACCRKPRCALAVRTLDDGKAEHWQLYESIEYGNKPATLKGLYKYLPKYVKIAFGDERLSHEMRVPPRKPLADLLLANQGAVGDHSVTHTNFWLVPDAPTSSHIDDPNNPDCED